MLAVGLTAGLFIYASYGKIFGRKHPPALALSLTAAQKAAALPLAPSSDSLRLPILMYHHIGDAPPDADATRKDLTVSTQAFQSQVSWLAKQGYQSIRLEDLYLYSRGQFQLPAKPIIFTFDDGYSDVFDNAVPVLKQAGFFGSFGIITDYPKLTGPNLLNGNSYASWQQIGQAAAAGNEIVSHTENHFDGSDPKFDDTYIFNNLSGSRQSLYDHLALKTNVLIYPYGHYSATYLEQAKKAGFSLGVTVREGQEIKLDDLMELPRLRVHGGEDLAKFIEILKG